MNTCGFEHGLTCEFTEEDPLVVDSEYHFSEWYPAIRDHVLTFASVILPWSALLDGRADEIIQSPDGVFGGQCFARLDPCSSKPTAPFTSATEICAHLEASDRTKGYLVSGSPNVQLILRKWMPNLGCEFRCFVHDRRLRAISAEEPLTCPQRLQEVQSVLTKITHYAEYSDYCADFTITDDGQLWLIEVNTPVWLYATSGWFDLSVVADREILLGDYIPDILSYPVVRWGRREDEADDAWEESG